MKTKQKLIDTDNRLMVTGGGKMGKGNQTNGEIGN